MMISLIVVALVGIGFTRLTMLALELRDNYDDNPDEPADIGRKRLEVHNKMVTQAKPEHVVVRGDNRYEAPGEASAAEEAISVVMASTERLSQQLASFFSFSTEEDEKKNPTETPAKVVEEEEEDPSSPPEEPVLAVDPTDVCTICFEKAKNAVLLGCGHGGMCYSCSVDVCVTSGHCPFCRSEISQIVTVAFGHPKMNESGQPCLPVIGPK
mmetsp:Transcript_22094/g.68004  ORF Transcript_22094/g.68004 Transcript_22094/m.68004 type:complete len:212 (-) Transcript_22094:560-1195(-)